MQECGTIDKVTKKLTAAPVPSKQEHPLESSVEALVQLVANGGSVVVAALFASAGAWVGPGSLLLPTGGKVALRAGMVVTVSTVVVLYCQCL